MRKDNCGCGCSLRTGCLVIGYIYAVLCGIGAAYCIFGTIVLEWQQHANDDDIEQPMTNAMSRSFFVGGLVCLKILAIVCLFLFGVHKGKPAYVLPWLICICASLVAQWGYVLTLSFALGSHVTLATWLGVLFGTVCIFALEIYIVLVISSHYHNMRKPSTLLDEEEIMM